LDSSPNKHPNFYIDRIEENKSSLERYMRDSGSNEAQVISLQAESKYRLLPDKELEWIDRDNPRLLRWLKHYCFQPTSQFGTWYRDGYSAEIKTPTDSFTA
jgi:hypothetical protein